MDKDKLCIVLLLTLFAIIVLVGCHATWKSPADVDRERFSIEHIHGPDCIHEHYRGRVHG